MTADETHASGPARRTLVAAVVPSHGRHADVAALLQDLKELDRRGIDLRIIVVDNASTPPLSELLPGAGADFEVLRLAENLGGSGGFNAGLRAALGPRGRSAWGRGPDFVWLLDSDVRVSPRSLRRLSGALRARPDLAAAGAAIGEPASREAYEVGGRLSRVLGTYGPMARGRLDARRIVDADYLSACCLLVRADAVERTGLMPEVFLNGDDIEWTIRLRQTTGKGLGAVAGARAFHPPARFVTWARYCQARNAFGPVDALRLGPAVRFLRAMVEGARAAGMLALGRDDLARLHVAGLGAAARGERTGRPPREIFSERPAHARRDLAGALGAELERVSNSRAPTVHLGARAGLTADETSVLRAAGAVVDVPAPSGPPGSQTDSSRTRAILQAAWRFVVGAPADIAVVAARDDPRVWFRGKTVFVVTPTAFWTHRSDRAAFAGRCATTIGQTAWLALRIALAGAKPNRLPPVTA